VPVETELKLAMAPDEMARLARHALLRPLRRAPARKVRVTSTYYDSDDLVLANACVSLRLRRDGRKWLQTVKGPVASGAAGGMTARSEFEWPVAGARLDPLRFATTPFRRKLGKAERHGLVAQFTTDIVRTTIPLAFADSTMASLCIDAGEVRADVDGKRLHAPINEIELELEAGDPTRLFELAYALAARYMAPARVEPLRGEFRWLAQALGVARDSDVFTLETLPAFATAVGRGSNAAALKPALRALAAQAAVRRAEAGDVARAAVGSPRFLRMVLAASALAASPTVGSPNAGALAESARDVARPQLKRRHRALLALGSDLPHAAPEIRHAARLAAKKLRYATEFFAPLFAKKRTRAYRNALTALQEELGAWNDAAVAARIAGELAGTTSAAAAAFSGWAAAQGSARSAALDAAWVTFAGAAPFWTRD
jgi:inorganic triphosphatase YgiF